MVLARSRFLPAVWCIPDEGSSMTVFVTLSRERERWTRDTELFFIPIERRTLDPVGNTLVSNSERNQKQGERETNYMRTARAEPT